jgi:hypothetical protein
MWYVKGWNMIKYRSVILFFIFCIITSIGCSDNKKDEIKSEQSSQNRILNIHFKPLPPINLKVRESVIVGISYEAPLLTHQKAVFTVEASKQDPSRGSFAVSAGGKLRSTAGFEELQLTCYHPHSIRELRITMYDPKDHKICDMIEIPFDVSWVEDAPLTNDRITISMAEPHWPTELEAGTPLTLSINYAVDSVDEAVIEVRPELLSNPAKQIPYPAQKVQKGSGSIPWKLIFEKPVIVHEVLVIMKDARSSQEITRKYGRLLELVPIQERKAKAAQQAKSRKSPLIKWFIDFFK